MVSNHNKRPLNDDDLSQLSSKQPRQADYSSHLSLFADIAPCNDILEKSHDSGEQILNRSQGGENLVSHCTPDLSVAPNDKEIEMSGGFVSMSSLSWFNTCTSEEKSRSEPPALHISCSPGYFEHYEASRPLPQSEMYSSLIDYPPRRLVSLGPDHQADVPVWGSVNPCVMVNEHPDGEKLLGGTCVIPMPDTNSLSIWDGEVGHGRTDCNCPDEGSVRCVRQHVMEAREKLKRKLGEEIFIDLGFGDMGEDVAGRWSEEEEQVFHEVVYSNPVSMGKNFWDHLSVVFPSKTKKDFVSYYFNVFMLRRRAEQNRMEPLNVDSDSDEWQGSEDGDEFGTTDEDDSGVESPPNQEDVFYNDDPHDVDNEEDGSSDDNGDECGVGDDGQLFDGVLKSQTNSKLTSNRSNPLRSGLEEQDVQDESCTSYESQQNGPEFSGLSDVGVAAHESCTNMDQKSLHREYGNSERNHDMVDHRFFMDHCDPKVWDIGFLAGSKEVDFLPTCNMIEEVFGDDDESWNNTAKVGTKNGPGFS